MATTISNNLSGDGMNSSEAQKALDASQELQITVTGRRTKKEYSTPVWFVREAKTIFLLPGGGSRSSWYKNAMHSERIKISSGKVSIDLTPKPIADSAKLASVVDKFRRKYGPAYYSDPKRFDVALDLTLP